MIWLSNNLHLRALFDFSEYSNRNVCDLVENTQKRHTGIPAF